jgi:osmotically-inducible protein OsmY
VKGNAVTLAGSVQDQEQLQNAEHAAGATAGVQSVTNDLVIREKGGH